MFLLVIVALGIWQGPRVFRSLRKSAAESPDSTPAVEFEKKPELVDPERAEFLRPWQEQVDQLLKWGVLFSILWLMGIGSLIALRNGLRARSLIMKHDGDLNGIAKAKWCIVAGLFGMLFWFGALIVGLIANLLEPGTY